jgi:predicted nucleic-acid-binding Zn-ribbon protein
MLINDTSEHKVISCLNANVGYNQIFMVGEDISKILDL